MHRQHDENVHERIMHHLYCVILYHMCRWMDLLKIFIWIIMYNTGLRIISIITGAPGAVILALYCMPFFKNWDDSTENIISFDELLKRVFANPQWLYYRRLIPVKSMVGPSLTKVRIDLQTFMLWFSEVRLTLGLAPAFSKVLAPWFCPPGSWSCVFSHIIYSSERQCKMSPTLSFFGIYRKPFIYRRNRTNSR